MRDKDNEYKYKYENDYERQNGRHKRQNTTYTNLNTIYKKHMLLLFTSKSELPESSRLQSDLQTSILGCFVIGVLLRQTILHFYQYGCIRVANLVKFLCKYNQSRRKNVRQAFITILQSAIYTFISSC